MDLRRGTEAASRTLIRIVLVAAPLVLVFAAWLAARTSSLNGIDSLGDRWVLTGYLWMLASLALLPVALASGLAATAMGRPWLSLPAAVSGGIVAAVTVFVRRCPEIGSTSPMRLLAAALVAAALCVLLVESARRASHRVSISSSRLHLAVGSGALVIAALILRGSSGHAEIQTAPRGEPTASTRRVLLIGFDGLDPDILNRLMARGDLPTFRRLSGEGYSARLRTLSTTLSPIVWTTIATGKLPAKHGIWSFFAYGVPGVDGPLQRFAPGEHCGNASFLWLLDRAHDRGFVERWPISRNERRTKAVWEMLSDRGLPVVVVNWWASWPATAVNGVLVSDRFHVAVQADRGATRSQDLTFPGPLAEQLLPDVTRPEDVTRDEIAVFFPPTSSSQARVATDEPLFAQAGADRERIVTAFHASDRTYERAAQRLLTTQPWQFAAVYFRGIDVVSHLLGAYSRLYSDHRQDPEKVAHYGGALEAYYRYADTQLADLLKRSDSATDVIVCSDHGFVWEPSGFSHVETAPDGVLLMRGPDIAPGQGRAAVQDIAATILRITGQPLAEDLDGDVIGSALRNESLPPAVAPMRSYESGTTRLRRRGAQKSDEEVREQLRALGYVQ